MPAHGGYTLTDSRLPLAGSAATQSKSIEASAPVQLPDRPV
jgi:hypothetical protein